MILLRAIFNRVGDLSRFEFASWIEGSDYAGYLENQNRKLGEDWFDVETVVGIIDRQGFVLLRMGVNDEWYMLYDENSVSKIVGFMSDADKVVFKKYLLDKHIDAI